jgi:hypothetical protein
MIAWSFLFRGLIVVVPMPICKAVNNAIAVADVIDLRVKNS